jgi:hypothetical protein
MMPRWVQGPLFGEIEMTDDNKMIKELILALTGWLNAKTVESKWDANWTKNFIDECNENKVKIDEEKEWPDEFDNKWS